MCAERYWPNDATHRAKDDQRFVISTTRRLATTGLEGMAKEAAEHARERYDKPWPSHKNRAVGATTQDLGRLTSTRSGAWDNGGW